MLPPLVEFGGIHVRICMIRRSPIFYGLHDFIASLACITGIANRCFLDFQRRLSPYMLAANKFNIDVVCWSWIGLCTDIAHMNYLLSDYPTSNCPNLKDGRLF